MSGFNEAQHARNTDGKFATMSRGEQVGVDLAGAAAAAAAAHHRTARLLHPAADHPHPAEPAPPASHVLPVTPVEPAVTGSLQRTVEPGVEQFPPEPEEPIQDWIAAEHIHPDAAPDWAAAGLSPAQAERFAAHAFGPTAARTWLAVTDSGDEANAWASWGFTPATAAEWIEQGLPRPGRADPTVPVPALFPW